MPLVWEPVTDIKIPSETENQLLPTTSPALKLNLHEKGGIVFGMPEPKHCSKSIYEENYLFCILVVESL